MTAKPRLIVMVKQPRPGRVKTRLAHDIGRIEATWWYRHHVAGLLREVEHPRWDTVLAVAPDRAVAARDWPSHLPRIPQRRGDLGTRMTRALRLPHNGPVCLIGSDISGLRKHHIRRAFGLLGQTPAVFGPSPDGGFWLIGLRSPNAAPAGFFQNVRWSSEHTLADSVASLKGMRYALADRLNDVDTVADIG